MIGLSCIAVQEICTGTRYCAPCSSFIDCVVLEYRCTGTPAPRLLSIHCIVLEYRCTGTPAPRAVHSLHCTRVPLYQYSCATSLAVHSLRCARVPLYRYYYFWCLALTYLVTASAHFLSLHPMHLCLVALLHSTPVLVAFGSCASVHNCHGKPRSLLASLNSLFPFKSSTCQFLGQSC
jgi:hypothetical protein